MMRRYRALFLLAVMAVSINAHGKVCYEFFVPWCDYILNGNFNNGGADWTESSTTSFPNVYRCGSWSNVAELQGTEYIEQTFYVDDTFSSFSVGYNAYLQGDTNNWYDELKITVTNLSTNQTELRRLRGSSYDTTCALQSWQLSRNYSNVWVKVRFEAGQYTLGTWEVDNVQFSAIY